jgi:hypothetical protein
MPSGTRQRESGAASVTRRRRTDGTQWPSSCIQTAARAFREYRLSRSSILSDESNLAGAPNMREQLFSKHRNEPQLRPRRIASTVLCASLTVGVVFLPPIPAFAQSISSNMPPAVGMFATSPLAAESARPAGIPLGSTEIATPGISPVDPSRNAGMTTCAGSDGAGPSAALFDGGGLAGSTSLSCADSRPISSPLPSPSSIGRVGIPLGATELGSVGISPATPATSPDLSNSANPTTSPGNP